MADVYTMLVLVAGIIITLAAFYVVSEVFLGENGIIVNVIGEAMKTMPSGCKENTDCVDGGVCVAGKCICFIDKQCPSICYMSIGKCK